MSKKKKSTSQKPFSEKSYLKSGRARKLPVYECLVFDNWEELQKTHVVIAREHKGGHITVALFLVDLLCAGIKDAFHRVNISKSEYQEILERFEGTGDLELQSCDYVLAHNIVYGALDYAAEFGIEPPSEFELASLVLDEDTEDIPLIELPLGNEGKPCLDIFPDDPRKSYYLGQLQKNVGPGNFDIITPWILDDSADDDEDWEDEDWEDGDLDEEYMGPDLEEWTREEWDDFITGLEEDELIIYSREAEYISKKCLLDPLMTGNLLALNVKAANEKLEITDEPMDIEDLSAEELKVIEKIHAVIIEFEPSEQEIKSIIKVIERSIERWPANPTFHNYHYNACKRLGQLEIAHKIAQDMASNFPGYFFGKMAYVDSLLEQERPAEALDVFEGNYDLASVVPTKKEFHISEFVAFYSLMAKCFMLNDDFTSALIFRSIIDEFEIPGDVIINHSLFFQLAMVEMVELQKLIEEVQQDEQKKEEVLDLLTAKTNDNVIQP